MSVQEASQQPALPSSLQPEAKPRPEVPPKPSTQACSTPEDGDSSKNRPGGKVQRIVNKFSKKDPAAEEQPTNGTAEPAQCINLKNPPPVKPKPRRSQPIHIEVEQAPPPLPMKRGTLQKPRKCVQREEGDSASVAGGRSEPDGKEVEVQLNGVGDAKVEDRTGHCCIPGCSCICHLQRPGMILTWVPANLEEDAGENETDEDDQMEEDEEEVEEIAHAGEGESEVGDEVDMLPAVEQGEVGKQEKILFNQSLNVLISEGLRRRSDPGPHSVLASINAIRSQSPPIPPKRTPPVLQGPNEESVYESILPMCAKNTPTHRNKLFNTASERTSDSRPASSLNHAPPAIPPRAPQTSQDCQSLNPLHRAIPFPVLTQVDGCPATVPHRPPPPPPKTDAKRLSNDSKKGEENGDCEGEKDSSEEAGLRRGSYMKWQSRLQDEPLYQTYRATVIHKEIRRQTVCRNISKTSVDYAMDLSTLLSGNGNGTGIGSLPPRYSPTPTANQSTLWQDLPAVRESGVLEKLTPEQCKYQESMFEVLTSEASYFRSLRVLTEHFQDSRELEETLIIMDKKTLFSNILKVKEISERFLKDLEERIFKDVVFSDICDIIYYHAQHKFPAFIDYVRNQIYQEQIFTKLMKTNVQFATVITRLQESPQCQRLPFMSFLLLPFQRITRIKMLIENILKRTKEGTKAEEMASKALASATKIIDECNTEVGKMRHVEELIQVSQTLEFDKLKAIPIISQTRYLEKKGELQEMSKGGTLFNMRVKFNPVYLFLFNDLLIIAVKKGAERFVVIDHAHRSLVQAELVDGASISGPYEHCFTLTLLENHKGNTMERLLKASTQSDMHRWMAAFPNPTNLEAEDDEVIYEDWDCPQVQCVEQYVGQQADELNLEPTDIINVIRKTNEGWYEGSRLSDGQKGWFPAGNVIEITNEHVRRRNLRERYRVMHAARLVSISKFGTSQ